jgi:phage gp45-like
MPDLERRIADLENEIRVLKRRQGNHFALSRSLAPAIDIGPIQTIQGQLDPLSRRDAIPVMMHYGFSSSMPVNGDKVVLFIGGDPSKAVAIATGHQTYRPRGLLPGQAVMYDMWGHLFVLNAGGAALTGNLQGSGLITAGFGGADQVGLQTHHHNAPGGVTSPPVAGS